MPHINTSKQSFNTLVIIIGAGLILYDFIMQPSAVYFKVGGLVILMFGLYKSTQQWAADNNRETPKDSDNTQDDE